MNEILEIIKKYNGSLISDIKDEESIVYDGEFIVLKNKIRNHFCIFKFEYEEIDTEEIQAYIEKCCNENEILKNIRPQFIYAIVILKTSCEGEELYKKVIEIEENEYFCKRYVFYYNDKEVSEFKKWAEKSSFSELIKDENNNKIINKKGGKSIGLKFLLKILVKFIFVKVDLEYKDIVNFEDELIEQLEKINGDSIKENIYKFNNEEFEKLMDMDLDDAVDYYLTSFREV